MDYSYYERKINNVIMKCPIETGVEILVFNVLDNIIESKGLTLVDINRLWKNRDKRLTTSAGVSDIAVVSNDFEFDTDIGQVFGFIEVKAINIQPFETEQVEGQKASVSHYIYTNGLVWKYYMKQKLIWEVVLDVSEQKSIVNAKEISIDEKIFRKLLDRLERIDWNVV